MLDSSLHFQRNPEASLKVSFYFPDYSVEMQQSSKMLYNYITDTRRQQGGLTGIL